MRIRKFLLISFLLLLSANICFAAENEGIKNIYGYLIGAGAGAALLALTWGGIRLLISRGDVQAIVEAKRWLVSGFTGLIIIAAAGTIYKGITGEAPSFGYKEPGEIEKPKEEKEKPPGIYLYSGKNCKEIKEKILKPETSFDTKSIEIINESREYLVVVKSADDKCQEIFEAGCHNLNFAAASIYTYQFNPSAEGRIIFYRRPYFSGENYDICNRLKLKICDKKIKGDIEIKKESLSNFEFKKKEGDCSSLYNANISCFGSFQAIGPYIIILYNKEGKCEVYEPQLIGNKLKGNQANLKVQKIFSRKRPYEVTIIPVVLW